MSAFSPSEKVFLESIVLHESEDMNAKGMLSFIKAIMLAGKNRLNAIKHVVSTSNPLKDPVDFTKALFDAVVKGEQPKTLKDKVLEYIKVTWERIKTKVTDNKKLVFGALIAIGLGIALFIKRSKMEENIQEAALINPEKDIILESMIEDDISKPNKVYQLLYSAWNSLADIAKKGVNDVKGKIASVFTLGLILASIGFFWGLIAVPVTKILLMLDAKIMKTTTKELIEKLKKEKKPVGKLAYSFLAFGNVAWDLLKISKAHGVPSFTAYVANRIEVDGETKIIYTP